MAENLFGVLSKDFPGHKIPHRFRDANHITNALNVLPGEVGCFLHEADFLPEMKLEHGADVHSGTKKEGKGSGLEGEAPRVVHDAADALDG